MQQDRRSSEVQMGLFQSRPERPEWKALPTETKQTVLSLLIELLAEAGVVMRATAETPGRSDD